MQYPSMIVQVHFPQTDVLEAGERLKPNTQVPMFGLQSRDIKVAQDFWLS